MNVRQLAQQMRENSEWSDPRTPWDQLPAERQAKWIRMATSVVRILWPDYGTTLDPNGDIKLDRS